MQLAASLVAAYLLEISMTLRLWNSALSLVLMVKESIPQ